MAERAALVTGASSGIGLAITEVLAQEGHEVTMVARRAEKLQRAVASLAEAGLEVHGLAADLREEQEIRRIAAAHQQRCGRLDVLINNAGVGFGAALEEIDAKRVDMQLQLNLRSAILLYRECVPLLRQAAAQHRSALVVNTASISGKRGQAWLSVYSATKHGLVGWTEAMNRELAMEGIKSTALCPAFVDTPMTDFVKEHVSAEEMITTADIAESVRLLLRLSPRCLIPEIMFMRIGDEL